MHRRKIAAIITAAMISNFSSGTVKALADEISNKTTTIKSEVNESVAKATITKFELQNSDKIDAYNKVFKMNNSNISSITNNGGVYGNSTIDKAIDGNLSTHWETGTPNKENFTNEVIVTLNEVTNLNRIVYAARQDGNKGKGFAQQVEIYSSLSNDGDDFKLVTNGEYNGSTGDLVEIKFKPTEFKRIKLRFKKANQDWASASEFIFYKEDALGDKVNRIFTNEQKNQVSEEFNTVEKINQLEEEAKSHPLYENYKEDFEDARMILSTEKIESSIAKVSKFDEYYSEYKNEYDNVYKMSNSNIQSITSTGGKLNGYVGTENIIDGDLETYWETGKHTSPSFNNELIFTLKENTVLNRIAYRSAWNTVGFAEEFEIWTSNTNSGDTFQLVSTGEATKTADVVEIKFNPTSFKRIKFVFKNSGTATASEMMFYKEDSVKDKIDRIFTNEQKNQVSEEFNTVEKINQLEEEAKAHPLYEDYKEDIENAKLLLESSNLEYVDAKVSKFLSGNDEKRNEYDNLFKVKRKDIISITTNGGQYAHNSVDRAIDGDVNTQWHSGKLNSSDHTNEVVITLDKLTTIDRITYFNNVSRGFAEAFDIYASKTSTGDTFEKISSGTASVTRDNLEIQFKPTELRRVKFVFKKGYENWAQAYEIGLYKEDKVKDSVSRLFTSLVMDTVSEEFNSIDKLNRLEEEAKNHPLYELFAPRIQEAKDVVSGNVQNIKTIVAEQHGDRDAHSSQNLKIKFGNNNQPTGVFALPGETVTVYVDVEEGKPLPKLVFSQQEGSWASWNNIVQLKPGKNEIVVPKVNQDDKFKIPVTPGGPVYISNPYTEEEQGKAPIIRFAKGVQAFPTFDKNTNEEEFIKFLKEYKEKLDEDAKQNPDVMDRKMIDTFELVADHIVITGTTTAAYEVYVNQGAKPTESIKKYNSHLDLLFKYVGIDGRSEKHDIKYTRENIRLAQPYAYMYAAGDHIGVQRDVMTSILTNVGGWGVDHEIGHNMDIGSRTIVEVTNNMLPMMTSTYYNTPDNRIPYESDIYKNVIGTDNNDYTNGGLFENLGVYWQLEMVYPGYWAKLNSLYRENDVKVKDDNDKLDKLAYYSIMALELDLSEHFERHGFKLSDTTKEFASKYNKPDKKVWYANNDYVMYEGEGFTGDPNLNISTSKEGENIKVSFNVDEAYKNDVMGYEVYRDGKLVAFTSTNSFIDTDVSYNDNVTYKVVPFDKKLKEGEAIEVSSYKPSVKLQQDEVTLKLRENFNSMDLVKAYRYNGQDITNLVEVKSNVNTNEKGTYEVEYSVTDENITTKEILKVNVVSDYDYLSDYEWESAETEYGTPRRNSNIKGRVNGEIKTFEKGFGIHADGKIVYDLSDKEYDIFEALLGVDMNIAAQNNSSITFKIVGDGKTLATTNVIKHADDMVYVNVPVKGVEELTIEIQDGGNNNSNDHGIIVNPKLSTNNAKPVIVAENKEYKVDEKVDLTKEVTAYDAEDGDISSNVKIVSSTYEEGKLGRFKVVYGVKDSDNNYTEKTVYVTVYEDFEVNKSKYGEFDNLNEYNEQFKIPVVSVSNNAGNYGNSVIGNVIDGKLNTHWETNKPNTDSFKNEVIFDLGQTQEISRIAYAARRDAGGKGFANKFEIYVSNDAEGNDFVLAGEGEYRGNSGDVVEFKINKTNARRVKFKFIEADRDWASLSEISFYKEDVLSDKIDRLFTDSNKTEISEDYNTLDKLDALDKEVKDHPAYKLFEVEINKAREIIIAKLPKIELEEVTSVKLNSEFNPMSGVSATDQEDGNITSRVIVNSEGFNINKPGEYTITYTVQDDDSNVVTKERKVIVYSESEYLSDTDWESARTDYASVRKDRSSNNSNIRVLIDGSNKMFEKGIGTHANSEIVYNLEGKNYEYFETYVGVDRNIAEQNNSSIIFKILADGEEVYNSGLMKYNTEAKKVTIPVKGVKKLELIVNNANNGNSSDHGNFADAKFLITNSRPKLTIPSSVSTKLGEKIDLNQEFRAIDAEDGDITSKVEVSGKVNFYKPGKYDITYKVTDSDGNEVVKTRSVAVVNMDDYKYLTEYDWKSTQNSYATPKKDKATSGNALRLTGEDGKEVLYERGIGAHSTSTITYDLTDKDYAYFTSYVGVDRQMFGSIGSVSFEVYVDGAKKFDSGLMNSKDPQKYVEVDINGAKELKLVVTDGGNGNGSDHATWADTKLHFANSNGEALESEARMELRELIEYADTITKDMVGAKNHIEARWSNFESGKELAKQCLEDNSKTDEEIKNNKIMLDYYISELYLK